MILTTRSKGQTSLCETRCRSLRFFTCVYLPVLSPRRPCSFPYTGSLPTQELPLIPHSSGWLPQHRRSAKPPYWLSPDQPPHPSRLVNKPTYAASCCTSMTPACPPSNITCKRRNKSPLQPTPHPQPT